MKNKTTKKDDIKKENKTKKQGKKKTKVWKKILIALFVLFIIGVGVFAGLIIGISGKYAITKEDLIIDYSNSTVVNSDEEVLAVLSGKENRKILSKSEMGEYLPKAFVAIEDKRFYEHKGVDLKRSSLAVVSFILHRGESASGGGSTLTQQLVKNITNEKDDSGLKGAIRKVKEMVRATQVEKILSKDQILELYMNIIYLGGNVNGVGMASEYYFSKTPTELSLAESAFIAGVTHSPNGYNPFVENPKTEKIIKRTKTVLYQMKVQGKISQEEYDEAVAEVEKGLNFKKGTIIDKASYSSHTEALIKQVINQLITEKGMDTEYAETYLYSSGLKIYSTEDKDIQEIMEDEYSKSKYQVETTVEKVVDGEKKKVKEAAQSAMVVIDQSNGYVVGAVGVLGEKEAGNLNRVNQARRQPGSSIKPIAVYGPALQEGKITAASVYDDVPLKFGSWTPKNSYSGFKGLSNMRQAVRISQNTIAIQVLQDLEPSKSIEYLKKLGVTSIDADKDNSLPLALGGINEGISPLEMAGAYAAIANDGEYITPTFYTKVLDNKGETILEADQPKTRVFSEQNAFLLKQLLIEPTQSGGTATNCKISKMDTAAKTGTTNSKKDKWLCGFTPYYTAATWYGYDTPTAIPNGATSNASKIWKNIMAEIHKDLSGESFKKPEDIVTANVCRDSGLLATDACKNDPRGNRTYTEYFAKGTVPTKSCTCHVEAEICTKTDKVAGPNCTSKEKKIFITRDTDNDNWKKAADAKYMLPTETCTNCLADTKGPVITLNGANKITLKVGEKYTEQGAKASDDVDGDVTSKIIISGTVDTKKAGTYTITYTVSDSAGNVTKTTRTVKIEEKTAPTPTPEPTPTPNPNPTPSQNTTKPTN